LRIYIAGPLFNTHERWYLEQIAQALEAVGYVTFVPHRDAGLLDGTEGIDRQRLFRADLAALDGCDACVALLTGADHDSGTCGELGYAYAKGKPCFGITDDMRWMNNLIWGLCGEGQHLAKTIDLLLPIVQRVLPLTPPPTAD
jgi:nucleoside 2-deoxyribosyltransferase